ncbi:MAG: YtxH domain-containing protein [Cyanobacteria bacterium J06639_1]
MAGKGTGAFLGGLLVGTAIGTAIGVLVAPRSGKETRRLLKKSADALPEVAEDVSSNLQYQTARVLESAQTSLDETLVRLQEAIAIGKHTMQEKQQELHRQLQAAEADLQQAYAELETLRDPEEEPLQTPLSLQETSLEDTHLDQSDGAMADTRRAIAPETPSSLAS